MNHKLTILTSKLRIIKNRPVVHLGKTKKLLISTEWIPFSFRQKTNVMSNLGSSYTKILALLHELENRDNSEVHLLPLLSLSGHTEMLAVVYFRGLRI